MRDLKMDELEHVYGAGGKGCNYRPRCGKGKGKGKGGSSKSSSGRSKSNSGSGSCGKRKGNSSS